MTPLATIGYQNATLDNVTDRLRRAGVRVVIDVRAIAASRRPGFSKRILAASLAEKGIDYVHLRALGTPKAGREAAHAGRTSEMRAIYSAHLEEPEVQTQLAAAAEIAAHRPAALLCYEARASECHRAIVAERIAAASGQPVVDL
jgi:uncharacterized protein (DUF488 family)